MKKLLSLFLILTLLIGGLTACGGEPEDADVHLSFKSASSYAALKALNGKTVSINGYMATSSPADGSFMFLMNLPYQSCPFCKPNTSELSNTMEIYPKSKEKFTYTNQAIAVTGTLVVADDPDKPFTDLYGYEFNFKIVDAEYVILKAEDLPENLALWQALANSNVINEVYRMFDFVNFCCTWTGYFVNTYTKADGTVQTGYYLWPADALNYLTRDGAQWNYGYKDGYFDDLVKEVRKVDAEAFEDLVSLILSAKQLAADAIAELQNGNYTQDATFQRSMEKFGTQEATYTLNNSASLTARNDALFLAFAEWLGGWEM